MRVEGKQVPNRPVRLWQAGVAIIVVAVVLVFSGLVYTNRAVNKSDHQWCSLLVLLDNTNQKRDQNGMSAEQKQFVEELHKLRVAKGC
jgi:hypothetical protein